MGAIQQSINKTIGTVAVLKGLKSSPISEKRMMMAQQDIQKQKLFKAKQKAQLEKARAQYQKAKLEKTKAKQKLQEMKTPKITIGGVAVTDHNLLKKIKGEKNGK